MIIVLVLAVLWGVILVPGILRRIRTSNSERSISSFHHSLELLENSGPKAFQPAYRLASGDDGRRSMPQLVPIAANPTISPRPQLVLLGPPGQGGVKSMSDRYEHRNDPQGYFDEYEPNPHGYSDEYDEMEFAPRAGASYPSDSHGRRQAARRRRNILFGLVGGVVLTAILGMVAPMFWMLTVVTVVTLGAYVGLMAWAATRGSISLQGGGVERHVARAVVYGDGRYDEGLVASEGTDGSWDGGYVADRPDHRGVAPRQFFDDDEWWDEPRRAAAR